MGLFKYDTQDNKEKEVADKTILQSFSEKDWARLLAFVDRVNFKAGDRLIHAGDLDRSLLIILEARVSIFQGSVSNKTALASFARGSVIGEVAFFDGEPRSADVDAMLDGVAIRISRKKFGRRGAWEPDLGQTILQDLAEVLAVRLRYTTRALNDADES